MDESFSSEFSNSMDDENLSQLDSSRSEDFSADFTGGSSSGTPSTDNPVSHVSDGSKGFVNIKSRKRNKSEDRVYTSLCRHLILEIFFEVNKYQIQIMGSGMGP